MKLKRFLKRYLKARNKNVGTTKNVESEDYFKNIAADVGKYWISAPYYQQTEARDRIRLFWDPGYFFRQLFDELDSTIILELAYGHGRHSEQMRTWPNQKILMDINQSNINVCIERFACDPRYTMLINNGYDCQPLGDASCTAVFCYDAMVHFDSEVVFSYLRDIFRILKTRGRALFHHSNYKQNPGGDYRDNPHWRNFMSQSLFKHYSKKSGLNIIDSVTLN